MVKTLKDAEERIRKAMQPPAQNAGQGFAPGVQRMRQAARRPAASARQLPTVK